MSDEPVVVVPLRERMVDFYGDVIPAAQGPDGEVYVPLRPLTDFLGVDFSSQRQRVRRDRVLAARLRPVVMARSDGRRIEMRCLPYEGWMDQIAGQLADVAGRQEVMADYLRGYIQQNEQRVTALELQLSSGAVISEAQATEIALAVKNVGQRLAAQGDRQGYAKVYSEMYRRYRVSSYKNLPAARYQEVLDWLAGWYGELNV